MTSAAHPEGFDRSTEKSPLADRRVVIDAFNADLPQGSGIATYTRTLCTALKKAGAEIAMLHGRNARPYRDLLARDASFHHPPDLDEGRGRLSRLANQLRRAVQVHVKGELRAYEVGLGGAVVAPPAQTEMGRAYNATDLINHAMRRHLATRQFTHVRLPGTQVDIAHLTFPWPVDIRARKQIVTIHDLIPLRLPSTTADDKSEYVARLRTSVARADLVVTVSEASKRDIITHLGVNPEKIAVTYQTSDIEPLVDSEQAHFSRTLARFGLSQDGYALFVSAIEPKKNLGRLVQAYIDGDHAEPLVVVGRKAWMWREEVQYARTANRFSGRARVIFLDYVARKELRFLYAGARCLLFPSLYEGFGLPCLEAMRMGTPVLTSNVASLPEVCGEAAVYVDPYAIDNIAQGIDRIMTDVVLRRELAESGRIQAQRFNLQRYVQALTSAYERLL